MWNSIQKNMTWRAIPVAGIVAGTAYLLISLILMQPVLEIEADVLLRYMASLVLGAEAVTEEGVGILVVGIIVHYVLSILFTIVIAVVIHRWGLVVGIIGGALLGLAIYAINLYTFTLFFDWFFAINSEVLVLSHVLFGAVAGGVYEMFDHYDEGLTHETA